MLHILHPAAKKFDWVFCKTQFQQLIENGVKYVAEVYNKGRRNVENS